MFSVVNSTGDWWLARLVQDVPNGNVTPGTEGWIPCTFMEPFVGELLPEKDHIVTKQKAQSSMCYIHTNIECLHTFALIKS